MVTVWGLSCVSNTLEGQSRICGPTCLISLIVLLIIGIRFKVFPEEQSLNSMQINAHILRLRCLKNVCGLCGVTLIDIRVWLNVHPFPRLPSLPPRFTAFSFLLQQVKRKCPSCFGRAVKCTLSLCHKLSLQNPA